MSPDYAFSSPVLPRNPWPRVVIILGLCIVFACAGLVVFERIVGMPAAAVDEGMALLKGAGWEAATVARAFHKHTVREEFVSSAVALTGTSRLQVATLQQHEIFRRKESDSIVWGLVSMPDIVVQADVPVEYNYYLDFNSPWEFAQTDDLVTAYPPPIQPNTPAPDISKLTFYTVEGRRWQDEKAVRDHLQASLGIALRQRAVRHATLVREMARNQLQTFVEKWLADSFSDGRAFHARVIFPEERKAQDPGPFRQPE